MRLLLRLTPTTRPIPFDHLHRLRGVLHKWLGPNAVHDGLSLYSFAWLRGGRPRDGGLVFEDGTVWAVSFADPALAKRLVRGILEDPTVFGGMRVAGVQQAPEPFFGRRRYRFLVAGPVLARRTRDDGGRDHLRWDDPAADEALTRTLRTKLRAAGLPEEGATVRFDRSFEGAKTKLCRIKGQAYRANACPVLAEGTPEQLRFLWLCGAGELTGSGLGALR